MDEFKIVTESTERPAVIREVVGSIPSMSAIPG